MSVEGLAVQGQQQLAQGLVAIDRNGNAPLEALDAREIGRGVFLLDGLARNIIGMCRHRLKMVGLAVAGHGVGRLDSLVAGIKQNGTVAVGIDVPGQVPESCCNVEHYQDGDDDEQLPFRHASVYIYIIIIVSYLLSHLARRGCPRWQACAPQPLSHGA